MSLSPEFKRLLERLGLNPTRIQWRLYRMQQSWQRVSKGGATPTIFRSLKYEHKLCIHCGALADRDDRVCRSCGKRMPSRFGYRLFRLLGLAFPGTVPATVTLFMAVMLAVFAATIAQGGGAAFMGESVSALRVFGAWEPAAGTVFPASPRGDALWRAMAFGLMHIGIIHIGFNFFALTQLGPLIEEQAGRLRMLVLITFTQITAAAGTYIWYVMMQGGRGYVITAGASGWLFGLIGFGIAYFRRSGGAGRMYSSFFVRWAIYGLLFGFLTGMANNAAHVGGLLGGMLLGVLPEGHMRRPGWTLFWRVAASLSAALWVVALGFLTHSIITNWGLRPGGP
ncbi:MAG: rhomboid family intramembrane serine protease [bacterium]|nr:rhomboid family intramembrane serine protease [bacterium]